MIITRTPLRISFVGGGSDLPAFYREEPGAVVTATINKHIYITVNRKFDPAVRLSYSATEEVERVDELKHDLARECLKLVGIKNHIEVHSAADVPGGTGLGSSSAYTVGLLKALHASKGFCLSDDQIAALACEIEIGRCGKPIGKQDQHAAAFGGLRMLEFHPDEAVTSTPIFLNNEAARTLQERSLLFYTGQTRAAESILVNQNAAVHKNSVRADIRSMANMAHAFKDALLKGCLDDLGPILHAAWTLKRNLVPGITNDGIDEAYTKARNWGATGGKLLGAGGGGFILLYAEPDKHYFICKALSHLQQVDFRFTPYGTSVIYNDGGGAL